MTGSILDLVLLTVVILFAVNGYRQGFVVGILSFAGFFGGALLGLQLAPLVIEKITDDGLIRLAVALIIVFIVATAGQALAVILGTSLRERINGRGIRTVDNVAGSGISMVAVLLVAWMVAAPLASAPLPWLASEVRSSAVIPAIDRFVPGAVRQLYASFGRSINRGDFPEVFGRLTPTEVPPVAAPDPRLANSAAVLRARESVVKVVGDAPSCSRRLEGTGFVFSPRHVLTNAHVVAGVTSLTVELKGQKYDAQVVLYDSRRDLAVLNVPDLSAPVMPFAATPAEDGASSIVVGYPLDGPYTATAARVRDHRDLRGPDIYNRTVTREVYTLRSRVRNGNSGGPLLTPTGQVYGVIFAAAVDDPETGFALTAKEAHPVITAGRTLTSSVSTGVCD